MNLASARRAGRRAHAATLYPLLALDSARRRRAPSFATADSGACVPSPSGVFAAMAHWCSRPDASSSVTPASPDRALILADCVQSLLNLDVERVAVAILTNEPHDVARDLSSCLGAGQREGPVGSFPNVASFTLPAAGGHEIAVIGWRPGLIRRHGFYLTWAHKPLFRRVLAQTALSHFIYLEDDIRFTQDSLAYWCRFREPLARHGLLPGFVRYEDVDGALYAVDQRRRQRVDRVGRRHVGHTQADVGDVAAADLRFVNLNNPYQGMYVLDRELAREHLWSSPARSPLLSRAISWPNDAQVRASIVRERAAIGPIFDDVPDGFRSRNVVPVRTFPGGHHRLDPACLIEHRARNYAGSQTVFGKIPVEDIFLSASEDAQVAGISPRQ
jgi:hypothetical protein